MKTIQESWSMLEFIRSFFIPMPLLTNGRSAVMLYLPKNFDSSKAKLHLECVRLCKIFISSSYY